MVCPCCSTACDCPNACDYQLTTSLSALTVSVSATAPQDECSECGGTETDSEPNPLNTGVQVGDQDVVASSTLPAGGTAIASGYSSLVENYQVNDPGGYQYARSVLFQVDFICRKDLSEDGETAQWFMSASYSYNESRTEYDAVASPLQVVKFQSSFASRSIIEERIKESCPADPVSWNVVVGYDEVIVNGDSYPWVSGLDSIGESCTENGSPCADYLDSHDETSSFVLERRAECEFP